MLSRCADGFSIQSRSWTAMKGPTPYNSVSGLPAVSKSTAGSGQRNALRAARRKARTKTPELSSAFRANRSARSAFVGNRERSRRGSTVFRVDLVAEFAFLFTRRVIEAAPARGRFLSAAQVRDRISGNRFSLWHARCLNRRREPGSHLLKYKSHVTFLWLSQRDPKRSRFFLPENERLGLRFRQRRDLDE